ncbi:MAG: hypothetical protein GXO59_03680 [Dictyoglomi bacterium]|nr:hypothetical protein [Dictyoglomota bacterium]
MWQKKKIGRWQWWWELTDENPIYIGSTATADVYSQYILKTPESTDTKNVISDENGYTYVEFDNINKSTDNLELYSVLGSNNKSCPYCENSNPDSETATMAYRYDTLQRYTVWFNNDDIYGLRFSPILTISPSTTCISSLRELTIQVLKDDWSYFYTSECDNFDQVAFTINLANNYLTTYSQPDYIIDVFKSEIYIDTWGYTIFDSNCNEIATYYLDSKNISTNNNGMITSITIPNISLSDLSNLNKTGPFYAWVKFKPTEDSADDIHVTLTITATYEANP